ncbi:hypothetical protein [Altererythrobacter sp. GH1-8]|uniref:hypothetical protein n=1 Tax=Altererythrobacter sp. GH1-8 TaxID=3349333 RepID=UPI00374D8BA0
MNATEVRFPDCSGDLELCSDARGLIAALSAGGDARITLDPETGINKYFSAPYPRKTLAYASSTANDLSLAAFTHLLNMRQAGQPGYSEHLEQLRSRIRAAYSLKDDVEVVFAPSGTDLEYVALAAFMDRAEGGIHNVLLGADEVGSGCIHSAHGRYFASETALVQDTQQAIPVEGFPRISLADVPVRCSGGIARSSREILATIESEIILAQASNRHALVHVVHGSKTGLILPEQTELEALHQSYSGTFSLVVDACQARITTDCVESYIARGAIVFLTGSKFMGGAPFSGFALVPRAVMEAAPALPQGLETIFRRAEFPVGWAGREILCDSENPGLALRLEGSVFELERFQALAVEDATRVFGLFQDAIAEHLLRPLDISLVTASPDPESPLPATFPLEMQTLATLDVSQMPGLSTFDHAQALHKELAFNGLRLGQPVKCVRKDGQWGGTLRIGLSMPQVTQLAGVPHDDAAATLAEHMQQVATRLREIAAPKIRQTR